MNAIDREGLKHLTTCMYTMFASAEVELRKHLTMSHKFNVSQIKDKIIHNEDVDFMVNGVIHLGGGSGSRTP